MSASPSVPAADANRRLGLRQMGGAGSASGRMRLIVNPTSRSGRGAEYLAAALPVLQRGPWEVEVCESRSGPHVRDLAAEAAAAGYGAVVVCGGDGSLHLAVGGLLGGRTALGLLPAGTGNDWARHVGLPHDPVAAAEDIVRGRFGALDVGRAAALGADAPPVLFNCVAGVGLDAEANRHIRAAPWLTGNLKYAYGGLLALLTYRPRTVEIRMNGAVVRRPIMFTAVTNTRTYGGGMMITPQATLDDGYLDVCVVEKMNRLKMLYLFGRVYQGGHVGLSGVTMAQSRRVEIDCPDGPMPLWLDGEPSGLVTPVSIEVVPAALRVFVP